MMTRYIIGTTLTVLFSTQAFAHDPSQHQQNVPHVHNTQHEHNATLQNPQHLKQHRQNIPHVHNTPHLHNPQNNAPVYGVQPQVSAPNYGASGTGAAKNGDAGLVGIALGAGALAGLLVALGSSGGDDDTTNAPTPVSP